ncbi:Zn-dependent hydrolase [Brevibacillus daliensis]|uniref:Zn-dependent hydrolase n=1 Tax=Brevibacillus daliensis TaxID=2892995 RepID=UPI001E4D991C|nr:Zn-dependent hydrolase [Brevibacillus daliensis]
MFDKEKHIHNKRIHAERLSLRIEQLAMIGKTDRNGVTRLPLTEEDDKAQQLVGEWMKQAGMKVRRDDFGNLIGRREGSDPDATAIMIGSHIDSVPNGGKFDGTVGVISGIEIVQAIHDANVSHKHPIEVIAFSDEEGARFSDGLFGSRGICGYLTDKELAVIDVEGISRKEAMEQFGLSTEKMANSVRNATDVRAYLEIHIEQGPYLQAMNQPVGLVTCIAGSYVLRITLRGEAGHAGTVPMPMRRDSMMGAAEAMVAIEKLCGHDAKLPTVGTVGTLEIFPGASNVIPSEVSFTLDIRDSDDERLHKLITDVEVVLADISLRRGLEYHIEQLLSESPVEPSHKLMEQLRSSADKHGMILPELISGAGHDAMIMASITEMAMLFVRCKDGISHNPKEWADAEDIAIGVSILCDTVLKLSNE